MSKAIVVDPAVRPHDGMARVAEEGERSGYGLTPHRGTTSAVGWLLTLSAMLVIGVLMLVR